MAIEMRDEHVLSTEPEQIVGYAYRQFGGPAQDPGSRSARLPLSGYEPLPVGRALPKLGQLHPEFEEQLRPFAYWLERFSQERPRARIRPDFISWLADHPG